MSLATSSAEGLADDLAEGSLDTPCSHRRSANCAANYANCAADYANCAANYATKNLSAAGATGGEGGGGEGGSGEGGGGEGGGGRRRCEDALDQMIGPPAPSATSPNGTKPPPPSALASSPTASPPFLLQRKPSSRASRADRWDLTSPTFGGSSTFGGASPSRPDPGFYTSKVRALLALCPPPRAPERFASPPTSAHVSRLSPLSPHTSSPRAQISLPHVPARPPRASHRLGAIHVRARLRPGLAPRAQGLSCPSRGHRALTPF